jgi:hypothetical protein
MRGPGLGALEENPKSKIQNAPKDTRHTMLKRWMSKWTGTSADVKTIWYVCEVCENRFRAAIPVEGGDDFEIRCPRCRTPFVKPDRDARGQRGLAKALRYPRRIGCG